MEKRLTIAYRPDLPLERVRELTGAEDAQVMSWEDPIAERDALREQLAQLSPVLSILSTEDMRRLRRFQEICEDSDADGHDLPKEAVRRLEQAGALRSCGFGRHEITGFGEFLLDCNEGVGNRGNDGGAA